MHLPARGAGRNSTGTESVILATLYERLGGSEGITKIAADIVDIHAANPRIAPRFSDTDLSALKNAAATFFIAGSGGPNVYQGKDMLSAHKGMNIDEEEFNAVLDDALQALDKNNVGQREKEEVLFILYSMKKDIVRV
jgi:hemoglobin